MQWSALVGGGLLLGCSGEPRRRDEGDASATNHPDAHTSADDSARQCPEPLAGGEFVALLPFVEEGGKLIGQKYGAGWDGRYYCDLSTLDTATMTMPIGAHYIRTVYPDLLDPQAPWSLALDGEVEQSMTLTMAALAPLATDMGVHLMECAGNGKAGKFGLISAAQWRGVPLPKLLAMVAPTAAGARVLVEGFDQHSTPSANNHSKPGASWVFTPEQLSEAFLATGMNGQPLPWDHGFPLRLLVPGWYGCCNIKWVTRIAWVPDDAPATAQMKEFASRTHQDGTPPLAAQYKPATMDQAAMPIRVERWRTAAGHDAIRLVGVMWGGYAPTDKLQIKIGAAPLVDVDVCPKPTTNATWTLWEHVWKPAAAGAYPITLHIDDPEIPTRRLDMQWYRRVASV